jgi:hypothetical protein
MHRITTFISMPFILPLLLLMQSSYAALIQVAPLMTGVTTYATGQSLFCQSSFCIDPDGFETFGFDCDLIQDDCVDVEFPPTCGENRLFSNAYANEYASWVDTGITCLEGIEAPSFNWQRLSYGFMCNDCEYQPTFISSLFTLCYIYSNSFIRSSWGCRSYTELLR